MTATITISCDGERHGQPCRGALPTPAHSPDEARHGYGRPAGWTSAWAPLGPGRYQAMDFCPSRGHDGQVDERE